MKPAIVSTTKEAQRRLDIMCAPPHKTKLPPRVRLANLARDAKILGCAFAEDTIGEISKALVRIDPTVGDPRTLVELEAEVGRLMANRTAAAVVVNSPATTGIRALVDHVVALAAPASPVTPSKYDSAKDASRVRNSAAIAKIKAKHEGKMADQVAAKILGKTPSVTSGKIALPSTPTTEATRDEKLTLLACKRAGATEERTQALIQARRNLATNVANLRK